MQNYAALNAAYAQYQRHKRVQIDLEKKKRVQFSGNHKVYTAIPVENIIQSKIVPT